MRMKCKSNANEVKEVKQFKAHQEMKPLHKTNIVSCVVMLDVIATPKQLLSLYEEAAITTIFTAQCEHFRREFQWMLRNVPCM